MAGSRPVIEFVSFGCPLQHRAVQAKAVFQVRSNPVSLFGVAFNRPLNNLRDSTQWSAFSNACRLPA